jgi:hypothetical protein
MIKSGRKSVVSRQAPGDQDIQRDRQNLSPFWIFSILLVPRLLAAQYSIIGDCDEGIASENR